MRAPDLTIGPVDNPQTLRWHIFRFRGWQLALHKWLRSDDDRALHDHVGDNLSLIVGRHGYWEIVRIYSTDPVPVYFRPWRRDGEGRYYVDMRYWRKPWRLYFRRAEQPHRVEVAQGPVWSIWFRWPPRRQWGFHCPKGWRHWREYCDIREGVDYHKPGYVSTIGKGCE